MNASVLTDQQLRQYDNDGFTVIDELIPADELTAVRNHLARIAEGELDGWPTQMFQIADPQHHHNSRGGPKVFGVQLPSKHNEDFAHICDHPRLVSAMKQILGNDIERHTDQSLIKHGDLANNAGGQSYYHQDSYYWKLAPKVGCNVWIALDDVGPDAIALGIMPGTHKSWQLVEHEQYYDDPALCNAVTGRAFERHRIPASQIDFTKETMVPLKPGGAAFFSNYTWHRADPNLSGEMKCAYAIAYRLIGSKPER